MFPTVDVKEIEDRWRPLSDAEKIVAAKRIEDAETVVQVMLRERGLLAPPPGDALWVKLYVRIIAEAVQGDLENPDGWSEESEQIDDYSITKRRASSGDAGFVISDDLLALLLPVRKRGRGAFSIVLGDS